MTKESSGKPYNWLIAIAVVSLALFPILFVQGKYEGADDRSSSAIQELDKDYKPWFKPLLEPASGEIETFLFASQAALGAGTIGYVIGLYKGRSQRQDSNSDRSSE
jgi:cobalt/nickel transport protein